MKRSIFVLVLLGVFCTLQAQEQLKQVEPKVESKKKPSDALETLQLATQLANYGYKTFSATALIEAAKIMSSVKTQDFKYEALTQGIATKDQAKKQIKDGYDLASILAGAKKFADGDPKLMAAISEIEKANQASRGRVGGPGEIYGQVGALTYELYTVNFIEGQLAEIAVVGDNDTDLDVYVLDSNANLISRDDDYTDRCYVSWVPRWTGKYYIKIINRGNVYNSYHLLTN